VIIGLGAGGFAAVLSARKTDRNAEIVVIDEKDYDLMHPCGIPYLIEGAIGSVGNLKHDLNLPGMRVAHYKNYRAMQIDRANKIVTSRNIFSGEDQDVSYDKLIISTGSIPVIPPVDGIKEFIGKGVFTAVDPEDAEHIRKMSRTAPCAVVLGAGAIGLEIASALSDNGCEVTVVEMLDHAFPKALDPDMAKLLHEYLEEKGIVLKMGSRVEGVQGGECLDKVIVDGEEVPCKFLILGAGARPNVELAKNAGIETGPLGIATDKSMLTSDKDIYAIGDCAQTYQMISGEPGIMPLSTVAYKQGTVAGASAAGADIAFPGIIGAFVSKVGEMEVASVGMNMEAAKKAGYEPVFGKIKDSSRPDWYPNGKEINLKVIVDKVSRKVLGAQAVGFSGAAWRINVVSASIYSGHTVDQLGEIELAYCPPVSQTYDALTKAADLAARKIR